MYPMSICMKINLHVHFIQTALTRLALALKCKMFHFTHFSTNKKNYISNWTENLKKWHFFCSLTNRNVIDFFFAKRLLHAILLRTGKMVSSLWPKERESTNTSFLGALTLGYLHIAVSVERRNRGFSSWNTAI